MRFPNIGRCCCKKKVNPSTKGKHLIYYSTNIIDYLIQIFLNFTQQSAYSFLLILKLTTMTYAKALPKKIFVATFLSVFLFLSLSSFESYAQTSSRDYFTVENYYKVKWGFAEEFISLWKTNHYPLLKKAIEKGDIISVTAAKPRYHSGEDTRWDFRVTLVFKNAAAAFDPDLTTPYKQLLFPDQTAYLKAEQHRFELLIAHWDTEVANDPLP